MPEYGVSRRRGNTHLKEWELVLTGGRDHSARVYYRMVLPDGGYR